MGKKKRGTKQFLVKDFEDVDPNEVTDSEDDYTEAEKELLAQVRNKADSDTYDSDDQVYGLNLPDENDAEEEEEEDDDDDNEGDKDSMKSDIEGLEDDELPNERAWGQKKRAYYSTDYVDPDYATFNQHDIATAELEEQEARNIQKRLVEQMDDADFGLDLLEMKDTDDTPDAKEVIKMDLTRLSKRQKRALIMKESPEFMPLVTDFKERMTEIRDILLPFLELLKTIDIPNCPTVTFIKTKYELGLNYCVNIIFYLMLKAKRLAIKNHPVMKRLAQYRQLLNKLQSGQGDLLDQVVEILKAAKQGMPLYIADGSQVQVIPTEKKKMKKSKKQKVLNEQEVNFDAELGNIKSDMEVDETKEHGEEEKRSITYQIAKNKGLTPYRKKEQRNPRVKHRNKYRKAQIRRKGAVRQVRKELTRYGGEISGIKVGVKKSIKLKY